MIGKNFGAYKIESKIGEGGMGVVYRAQDTDLDRPVAIKMVQSLSTHVSDSEAADSISRFMREAKAASRLQHPAIMTIYQFGVQENTRYLVMEFIEGRTLKKIIEGKPMAVNTICEIGAQVADGLAEAHEKGVIHRDMKAENIMVTPRGQAKILDFGLAKLHEDEAHKSDATVDDYYKTQIGTVLGTVSNMSPEQALGNQVDAKSDIFSFGVVLYEMATGKSPFIGPTPQSTMARVLNQEPAPVCELNPSAPPELEVLIHACLRKSAKERPSAKEVTGEFKRIQASLSARNLVSSEIRSQFMPSSGASRTGIRSALSVAPVSSSKIMAPGSGAARASGFGSSAEAPPKPGYKYLYYALKTMRIAVSIALLTVPLSFFLYMMVSAGLVRAEIVEGSTLWNYVKIMVVPSLQLAEKVFTVRPVYNGWNFMLAGLGVVAIALRHLLLLPIEQLEHWLKTKVVKTKSLGASGKDMSAQERGVSHRLTMLREYSEAQNLLTQEKRPLAFLSIDVVGSSRMKQGEDKLVIEHAFSEYQKFVDRILKANGVWKVASTPDGIMCAFPTPDQAVKAGQTALSELPWFNNGVHRLKTGFAARCGVNSGEVIFPEEKAMEEISDEVIDIAGHMQKYAAQGALWLSRDVLEGLSNKENFRPVTTQEVDGLSVFEWVPAEMSKTTVQ